MARYLAVSGREITSYDMHSLGLVSHLVEDEPHYLIARTLAESFSDRFISPKLMFVRYTYVYMYANPMHFSSPTYILETCMYTYIHK